MRRSGADPAESPPTPSLSWRIFQDLCSAVPASGRVEEVIVGLHWTAVVGQRGGERRCGLASTATGEHAHGEANDVVAAGGLAQLSLREMARFAFNESPTERALGLAAINAGLPVAPSDWPERDAAEAIAERGAGKRVALVGHFPFISEIEPVVGELFVLELDPSPGELPASAAPEVLPTCSVVAITSLTLLNGTFDGLMENISGEAYVILLGPTSPLSPLLFQYGVDLIAGTYVSRIDPVMTAIKEGANYRQIHKIGTKLVTLAKAATREA